MKRKSFKANFLNDEIAKREKSVKPKNCNKEVELAKQKKRHTLKHQIATKGYARQENFQQRVIEKIHTNRGNERKTLRHIKCQSDKVYANAG